MTSNTKQNRELGWKKGAIAIGLISLFASSSCARIASNQPDFDRFADWCENRETLTRAAQHTVDVLLEEAGTTDCQSAEEHLTSLDWLDLENKIVDVSPLSSLDNLKELSLTGNRIEDVSPLSSLTNLESLWLAGNRIVDVNSLSSLTNLTILFLGGNRIVDVNSLSSLTNLKELFLGSNRIEDVSPLSSLSNLTRLDLAGNRIVDVNSLSSLSNLTRLQLYENKIIDRTCPVEPQSVCEF